MPNSFEIPEEVHKQLEDPSWVKHHLATGKSLQEILQLSDQSMDYFYTSACALYEEKAYRDAEKAFLFLTTVNPDHYDYWLGLGAALQGAGMYENAIDAYEMAAICQIHNPLPYFHLAKCLFAIHERASALQAIELAIEYARDQDGFVEIYERALKAKDLLLTEETDLRGLND